LGGVVTPCPLANYARACQLCQNINYTATGVGGSLATIFKSLLTTQKSYIENSIDLVEKLKNYNVTEKTILSCFDAVSMYTLCDFHKCEPALPAFITT